MRVKLLPAIMKNLFYFFDSTLYKLQIGRKQCDIFFAKENFKQGY